MSPRKTQARSEDAIRDIITSARAAFAANGYALTGIDDIAAAAGRTKGAVYHHFADKAALFRAVFVDEQRRLADAVVTAAAHDDPVESLVRGLATYLELIAASPDAARLTLLEAPQVLGWQEWRSCDDGPFRRLLHAAITRIEDAGRLDAKMDPDVLTELLLGAVTESALQIATTNEPLAPVGIHTATIRVLVERIGPLG